MLIAHAFFWVITTNRARIKLHDTVTGYVTLTEQGSCSGCHTPVARGSRPEAS